VCNGIPPPEPAQISAGSPIRVFISGTKATRGGNDAFGRCCGQFSVGRGIGTLTVKIRRGAHAVRTRCARGLPRRLRDKFTFIWACVEGQQPTHNERFTSIVTWVNIANI
jgi:hypothetical protein